MSFTLPRQNNRLSYRPVICRQPAASTAGGGRPDCDQFSDDIRRALYANKRSPGETDGMHGYLNRVIEQMCGRSGPGTTLWKNHVEALRSTFGNLEKKFNDFQNKKCPHDLLSREERSLIGTIRSKLKPDSIQWLGPDHARCINAGEAIASGRLRDLLSVIRP